tara:strand:- start:279 stop:536 length:258 start_codon:yes stop_codon:yes gene_type:complete
MSIIQPNGERHYSTEHGVYVVRSLFETNWCGDEMTLWEIFAPKGYNFNTAHSLLEDSLKEVKYHIGTANTHCDETCGCEFFKEGD